MASGNARPARKNIADETSRLTSSQNATAEIRASAEVRGAPVSRSTRTAATVSAAAMMTTTTDSPSQSAPSEQR